MKVMVVIIVCVLIIFSWNLFLPTGDSEQTENLSLKEDVQVKEEIQAANEESTQVTTMHEVASEEKAQRMREEYKLLEQARRDLKRKLSRLKHEMWDLTFPKAQAKEISEVLLAATNLIKNPHKLGAFRGVEDIRDEITKIDFTNKSLDQIKVVIDEARAAKKESAS